MTATLDRPTWSKSRVSDFQTCQRKYCLATSPDHPEAKSLKKLKNRHLWGGSMVHEAVGDYLRLVRQGTEPPESDQWVESIRTKMRDQFRESQKATEPTSRLFEHEYNVPIDSGLWKDQWIKIDRSLRWFLHSPWLTRLKALGPESWKVVDEVLDFDIQGIQVYVKIDCAIETKDRLVLIDWKTGAYRESDQQGLQVASLYAHDVWDHSPDSIDAYVVSLQSGTHHRVEINEESLMETQLKIQEETDMLQSVSKAENPLSVEMTTNVDHCFKCNFQKLCHPKGVGF